MSHEGPQQGPFEEWNIPDQPQELPADILSEDFEVAERENLKELYREITQDCKRFLGVDPKHRFAGSTICKVELSLKSDDDFPHFSYLHFKDWQTASLALAFAPNDPSPISITFAASVRPDAAQTNPVEEVLAFNLIDEDNSWSVEPLYASSMLGKDVEPDQPDIVLSMMDVFFLANLAERSWRVPGSQIEIEGKPLDATE